MGEKIGASVAVIVVAYQSDQDVERCLASLKTARRQLPNLTLWLVDNSYDLDVRKRIRHQLTAPWQHYFYSGENLGFASGNNLGLKKAAAEQPDFFFLINADAALEDNCLERLIETAANTPAAAYGPLMLYEDGTVYWGGGYISRWLGAAFHPGRGYPPRPNLRPRSVSFINGCGLLLPRSSYERFGGLDEDYFMYYEETDWCAKVAASGERMLFVPDARLIHFTDKGPFRSASALYYLTRNQWRFIGRQTRWYHRLTGYPLALAWQIWRYIRNMGNPALRQAMQRGWRDALSHRYGKMV